MVTLSPLQLELFELLETQGVVEPFGVERDGMAKDISGMNAIELRKNIKVFKETF